MNRLLPMAHPEDLRGLSDAQRRDVVAALIAIQRDPEVGKELLPLRPHQRHRGSLVGLRAARIPGVFEGELRVVYAEREEGIEVVAIAPRRGSECYRLANRRLYPDPRPVRRMAR